MMKHTGRLSKPRYRARLVVLLGAGALLLSGCGGGSSSDDVAGDKSLKMATFAQVDVPATRAALSSFRKTFTESAEAAGKSVEWTEVSANGDPQQCQTHARELAGKKLDGVAIIGTPCILAMKSVDNKTPIFTVGMTDPVGPSWPIPSKRGPWRTGAPGT